MLAMRVRDGRGGGLANERDTVGGEQAPRCKFRSEVRRARSSVRCSRETSKAGSQDII